MLKEKKKKTDGFSVFGMLAGSKGKDEDADGP